MKDHNQDIPAVSSPASSTNDAVLVSDRVTQWADSWAQQFRSSVQDAVATPAAELMPKLSTAETPALRVTPETAK